MSSRFFLDRSFLRLLYRKLVGVLKNFRIVKSKSFQVLVSREMPPRHRPADLPVNKAITIFASLPKNVKIVTLDCDGYEIALYMMWDSCRNVFRDGESSFYDCTGGDSKSISEKFRMITTRFLLNGNFSFKTEKVRFVALAVEKGSLFPEYFVCGFGPLPEDKTNRVQILDLMPDNVKEIFCTYSQQSTGSIFRLWNDVKLIHQYMYFGARDKYRVPLNFGQVSKEPRLESFYGVDEYWRSHSRNSYRISDGKCSANVSFELLTKKILLLNLVCVACSSCSYEMYRPPVCRMSSSPVCPSPQADPCFTRSSCRETDLTGKSKQVEFVTGFSPEKFVDGVGFKVLVGCCALLFLLVVVLAVACSALSVRRVFLLERNEDHMIELYSKWNNQPENPDRQLFR